MEVCFCCSPTYPLQLNCALDKWGEQGEVAIKINHLDKHTHTHTYRRLWGPVFFFFLFFFFLWLCKFQILSCLISTSSVIFASRAAPPICHSLLLRSSNYCITDPALSYISSQHSSSNYLLYPFYSLSASLPLALPLRLWWLQTLLPTSGSFLCLASS